MPSDPMERPSACTCHVSLRRHARASLQDCTEGPSAWSVHVEKKKNLPSKITFKDHRGASAQGARTSLRAGAVLTMGRNADDLVTADAKVAEFTCSKVFPSGF